MSTYWQNRAAAATERASRKNIRDIEKQMREYYARTMGRVIDDFENTYNKLLATVAEGQTPTPADLYKLDKYWQTQGQLRLQLQALGDKKVSLMSKIFELNYFDVYYSINIEGLTAFTTIDSEAVQHFINQIWCADGKSWSDRIWQDTSKLQQVLNDNLIDCVITGKKPTELKKRLQEQFNVSYRRADTIVRTEMAHIQTQAAAKRYQDYGLKKYEILGNEDDTCGNHSVDCHKMDGKQFLYSEMSIGHNAPPFHPNCRCAIIPVVDEE